MRDYKNVKVNEQLTRGEVLTGACFALAFPALIFVILLG